MNKKVLSVNDFLCFFITIFTFFISHHIISTPSKGTTYVVIGSSAASISAVKRLTRCALPNDLIIMISKENEVYDRRRLKRYMQKERSPIFSLPKNDKVPIEFIHTKVQKIDRFSKKIFCANSAVVHYDYLFLGIGGKPVVPVIEGMDSCKSVFGYHTLADVHAIRDYIKSHNVKNIAVVGGGLASLELTEILTKKGYKVHHCVRGQRILRDKADVGGAEYIQDLFSRNGVKWYFNTEMTRVVSSDSVITGVVLNNQGELAVDMMIYAIGTKVETDLVDGLKTEKGAFLVDEFMRTSDPYIYAGGDAACVWDYINNSFAPNGKWSCAKEQGQYAAKNMCGIKTAYPGTVSINLAKYFKARVALSGPMGNPPADYNYVANKKVGWFSNIMDALFGTKRGYRSFLKKNEQLKGFCLIDVPLKEIKEYVETLKKNNQ